MSLKVVTDPVAFDFDQIVPFVQSAYWGAGRSAEDIRASFANSACVGLFEDGVQLAMARAVTDGVFHAYVYDVGVFEPYRGRGLSLKLMDALLDHPDLRNVKGWMLSTRDAHGIYERYGFERVDPDRVMWMRRD